MSTFLPGLIVGLVLGVIIGWLFKASRNAEPATTNHEVEFVRQLAPLQQAVDNLGGHLRALETDQAATSSSLISQVQAMTRTSTRLNDRTDELIQALRAPQIRGRWGEVQLERVVELGGMKRHCDFDTQVSTRLGDQLVRPDLIVHLAGGRTIIVDSKVPFSAYLDAMDTTDPEEKAGYMRRHAHLLRTHINQLSDKNYTAAFHPTPEFVVAFVPADPFLDAALETDPELLEYGFSKNVVVATPTTLFALLRTVALGWQQEDIADKAVQIQRLGRELYERLNIFGEHYARIGRSLDKAVEVYNSTLGSLDSRVMVTARRLAEMELSLPTSRSTPDIEPVTRRSRPISGSD